MMTFTRITACCMTTSITLLFSAGFSSLGSDDDIFIIEPVGRGVSALRYNWDAPAIVNSIDVAAGSEILPGREMMVLYILPAKGIEDRSKAKARIGMAVKILSVNVKNSSRVSKGDTLLEFSEPGVLHDSTLASQSADESLPPWSTMFVRLWQSTGIYDIIRQSSADFKNTWQLGLGRVIMLMVGMLLLYLAIFRQFEPLLLVPIGFGAILANIPLAGIAGPEGILGMIYAVGIATGIFPLLIFMGVGAMTDFGPLIANPKTALLGAAAQFGIFTALLGALLLSEVGIDFSLKDAASIGIIGGADGPTAIFLASQLSPRLLGAIAVAAYSYMALVPIIQPPIMKLLTSKADRRIRMSQLRHVSKIEKICFPIVITLLCALLLPSAAPLIGMLMFGNLMRECGVVERLSSTAQHALINTVTIFLGLCVGSRLSADQFLNIQTLGILLLGVVAFGIGTASGVLFGQLMKKLSGGKINPLIGAAGVSAVPMAARVVNKMGLEEDNQNFLLMHAMGPNVAGVIGSAVAAGAMLKALSMI
ncbi:MAG: sodium ion-translocating decarboxylase subunit beta [Victivallales bacterium]|nr:sodium ion-translocating decarboxylase subunit beta [Victivallales bacterium]